MARKKDIKKEEPIKNEPAESDNAPKNFVYYNNGRANGLMWLGVAVISIIIVALWGWNITLKISNINFSQSPEKQIVNNAQSDWNKIFNETKTEAEKQYTLSQLKNILLGISNQANNTFAAITSTTPAPAVNISTTTNNIATTTNE